MNTLFYQSHSVHTPPLHRGGVFIEHPINFTNPELQFPQFKVLQCFFLFNLYWHFLVYFDINLKLLPGKYSQKVNKQNIRVS